MFNEILAIIAKGEPLTLQEVAKRAHLDEKMMTQVFSDLLRMGYLDQRDAEKDASCSSGCGGCSGCATTFGTETVRLHVTKKGEEKIARHLEKIEQSNIKRASETKKMLLFSWIKLYVLTNELLTIKKEVFYGSRNY